ncbi:retrovirus-related pol polyprotein from transposon TNT 1-94 [Tanacetum coccineum]
MDLAIMALRNNIDATLLADTKRRWISDSQNLLREFYKTDVISMSESLTKNLKELQQELVEEVQEMLNIFESMEQKVKEKSPKDNIFLNEIDQLLEVSLLEKSEIVVDSSNSVRRPKSKDTKSKNRILKNANAKSSSTHLWKVSSSVRIDSNKRETINSTVCQSNASVLNINTVNAVNDDSNFVYVSCGKYVFMLSPEKCVARYDLSIDSRVKTALFTTPLVAKSKNSRATSVVAKSRLSIVKTPTATTKMIQLVLWIVDSGCSKHMTGNLQLLRNFVEKFMGTVRFGNDHFNAITGYGDYVQGNLTICHVYNVEGLGHNLFLVEQFCDGDLEVAFRSNTCYVQNLEGDDLLTGSRDSNLYTISIPELAASTPVCLMSKATSTKSWLWHIRLSHLNFGKSKKASFPPKLVLSTVFFLRTKDEAPNMIINFINQAQQNLKAQIQKIRIDNGTEFKNKKLRSFYAKLGIVHNTSTARMP